MRSRKPFTSFEGDGSEGGKSFFGNTVVKVKLKASVSGQSGVCRRAFGCGWRCFWLFCGLSCQSRCVIDGEWQYTILKSRDRPFKNFVFASDEN